MSYTISKTRLLFDLYVAFEKAKRHKGKKSYIREFEENLHSNLLSLCDEIWERRYQAMPSTCFIINHPKKREVFAADFRDRIVHHLYYNYTHQIFERTFIEDCYSCIKNKGTHYGIHHLEQHIREESNNYQDNCYILKMDIKGYFMNINRNILLDEALKTLNKMRYHKISGKKSKIWDDIIDFEFVMFLTERIVLLDPTVDCIFKSNKNEWIGLADSKSMFKMPKNCGLPIGNLTSQLFSNVYLNTLDQYAKRVLKCKHYGRYVDDLFIVSKDKEFLHDCITKIESFMEDRLSLKVQKGKTIIRSMHQGVEFLGAYIKPYRTYISNQCLRRIKKNVYTITKNDNAIASINSWLGIFSHYNSFRLRVNIFTNIKNVSTIGVYDRNFTKLIPINKLKIK